MTDAARSRSLAWLLVVAWATVIWTLSSAAFSATATESVIVTLLRLIVPDLGPEVAERINFLVRKSAHLSEYAVLGALALRAAALDWRGSRLPAVALVVVIAVAAADEWRQSHIAERTAAFGDVAIDSFGGVLGICAMLLWQHTRRTRRP
jgi:VanZ family protein